MRHLIPSAVYSHYTIPRSQRRKGAQVLLSRYHEHAPPRLAVLKSVSSAGTKWTRPDGAALRASFHLTPCGRRATIEFSVYVPKQREENRETRAGQPPWARFPEEFV